MRFLCPKCKAKYQIADQKLEGRAVRMKCRKCGHVIEVPSPTKKTASGGAKPLSEAPSAAPARPEAGPKPAPRPGVSPSAAAPPRPKALRPSAPSVPRGDDAKPSPAPIAQPQAASSASGSEPPAGGLAGAFSQKVREPQASDVSAAIEVLSAGASEEWYVGVNGVPLGPVRLSTLRQKAQQGAIDEESLVWREGFEEWLPLRTFPELMVLVRESREGSGRVSYTPAPPQAHSLSQGLRAAPAAAAPAGRIDVAPVAPEPRPGAAAEIEQEPATVVASSPEGLAAMAQAQVTRDPFAPQPAAPGAAMLEIPTGETAEDIDDGDRRSLVDDIAVGVRRQVRMHPAAYVLIAIGFGFGVTGAIVFFTNEPAPAPVPTIQVVTVTAPSAGVPAGAEAPAASVAMTNEGKDEAAEAPAGGGRTASNATAAKVDKDTAVSAEEDKEPTAPRRVGLGDGPSISGPSVAGPGAAESNLPQQLDQSDIERVVATHRASVKRGCWEPALASRDRRAPKSAKVTVSISIGPSGRVSSASASGGAGYPGLSSCVANKVRMWKFPPSGGTSQANIPFAFFAQ